MITIHNGITIRNCDSTCISYTYIIYRVVEGVNWYYCTTNDLTRASQICAELGSTARIAESENCNCLVY